MSHPIENIINPQTQLILGIDDGFSENGGMYAGPSLDLSYFVIGQHRTTISIPLRREAAAALRQMADELEAAWDRQDARRGAA